MFRNGKKPEYKSPISIDCISKEIVYSENEKVIEDIRWKLQVDVDKEELLKALAYDRNQYEKGYNDAKAIYGKALDKACEQLELMSEAHYISREDWKEWLMKDE